MWFTRSLVTARARLEKACPFEVESLERRVLLSSAIAAFGAQQTFFVGSHPGAVATADLNGDGKLDIVAGTADGMSVLLGNGDGTFAAPMTVPGTANTGGPTLADVNGDGRPDLLVMGRQWVGVCLGNGNGTFQLPLTFTTGTDPHDIAVADVNGDGKPDLVVTNLSSYFVSVLLGNGNGTFQQAQIVGAGQFYPTGVAVADFNGDGKPDIAITNGYYPHYAYGHNVTIMLGNGNGTFQPGQTFAAGAKPNAIVATDVNGDGKIDLVTANINGGNASVLLGNGNGTFQPPIQTAPTPTSPSGLAVADVNGDGKQDVILANFDNQPVSVLLGNGDGTFQPPATFAAGPEGGSLAVADLNRDGRLDLVVGNFGVGNFGADTVGVLLGDVPPVVLSIDKQSPTGPIDSQVIYTVKFSEPVTGVDATDFALALNGITANPPVVTGSGAVYTVTINGISGDGTLGLNLVDNGSIKDAAGNPLQPGGVAEFGAPQTVATGNAPLSIAAGDLNGDGNTDLVVGNVAYGANSITVLLGNGNGTFQRQRTIAVGTEPRSVTIADVNRDGKRDVIVVGYVHSGVAALVGVLLGNGNGTFQPERTYFAGNVPVDVQVADLNGDDRPDLIVVNTEFGPTSSYVLLGNGNGTFQTAQSVYGPASSVTVADLNGDGKPDLAFAGGIVLGNGNGTFQAPQTFLTYGANSIAAADMNGDGKLDLVMNDGRGIVDIFLGNGNGTFRAPMTFAADIDAGVALSIVADVNGDGKADVVVGADYSSVISVLLGNGNGTLAPTQTFFVPDRLQKPLESGFDDAVVVADLNHDGRPDIVVTGGAQSINVLLGAPNGSFAGQVVTRSKPPFPSIAAFAPQQTIAVGTQPRSVVTADLNGDGKPDLVVVNSASDSVGVMLGNGNGTFAAERTFATGLTPWSVAVADVNHDGKPDLIVADSGGNDVSVLLGNGNGTFQTRESFAVGSAPKFVAASDINGDGKPDIITANYGSRTVSVLLGNGDGTLASQRTFATGSGPISIAVSDFNIDGKPDLAVANRGANSVSLLLGNGNGTFRAQVTFAVGSLPDWIAAADVNVDGSPDIVVANQGGNSVGVLLGNGDGTFLSQQAFAAGSTPVSLAIADINGDGSPDLIVTDYFANAAAVLIGNGDGTFQAIKTFATGTHPSAVAVADLNRDGRLDLIVSNLGGNNLSALLGDVPPYVVSINRSSPTGPTTSASTVSYTVTFSEPVTGVDDGDFALALDGVSANTPVVTPISGSVYTVTISGISGLGTLGLNLVDDGTIRDAAGNPLQPGGVSFQPQQQTYYTQVNNSSLVAADMNLDGRLDLLSAQLLIGNGDGSFQRVQAAPVVGNLVAVADLNGDGKPDFVSSGRPVKIYTELGVGDGTFRSGATISTAGLAYSTNRSGTMEALAVGDINGDGVPDIVGGFFGGTVDFYDQFSVAVWLGNGDGTFKLAHTASVSDYPNSVVLADVNGDGTPDIIFAYKNGTIGVNGVQAATVGTDPVSITAGDVNGDGKIDLIVANHGSDDLSILLGNGNGTFQPQRTIATGHLPKSVAVADVNGDGIPDLVVANDQYSIAGPNVPNGSVGVFLGNGNGTFQAQQTFATGSKPMAVAVADISGNGRPDLIVTNYSSSVSVLLGNSTGSFTGQTYAIVPVADTINGTNGNDTITLQRNTDGTAINWTMGASSGQFPANDPAGLTINGNGGNDTVNLDYTNGDPLPNIVHLNGTFTINNLQGTNPLSGTALDIERSTVFISYGASDPVAAIRSYLQAGYNSGAWNGAATASTGVITSAAAQTNPNHNTAIGYADFADGQGINTTPNTIELRYTLYGDANLDAQVNSADLQILLFSLNRSGAWDQGDFNYDGQVNSADLQSLLFTLNTSLGSQATPMAIAATPSAKTTTSDSSPGGDPSPDLLPAINAAGSATTPSHQSHPAKVTARKRR